MLTNVPRTKEMIMPRASYRAALGDLLQSEDLGESYAFMMGRAMYIVSSFKMRSGISIPGVPSLTAYIANSMNGA